MTSLLLLQNLGGNDVVEGACESDGTSVLYYLRKNIEHLTALRVAGIALGGPIDSGGNTLAHYAVMRVLHAADENKRKIAVRAIRLLHDDLELSFSEPCESEGNTPLYFAAACEPLLRTLAAIGVDLSAPCSAEGSTITYYARNSEKMVRALHELGVDLTRPCDHVGNRLNYYGEFDPDLDYLLEQLEVEFPDEPDWIAPAAVVVETEEKGEGVAAEDSAKRGTRKEGKEEGEAQGGVEARARTPRQRAEPDADDVDRVPTP